MDLNELITLSASAILGGTVASRLRPENLKETEIERAVKIAKAIWAEVLRQEHEE
jgi:hypothetical protein